MCTIKVVRARLGFTYQIGLTNYNELPTIDQP